ncbi:pyroglutamyl-peptidase I [Veronia nyctiphanis]|uniref:Pyrrolidone-carboxylate peptidase n=1 Tax=Veronia nyctiphanis TaxID=1278244 RepID=A0A4Q0YRH8_9GAMM|nr:pyroglutamyl-peptidase I [Veronia nyctiphanis]RXJ71571.1 pyroglutamyl-peptidase I [Veronia nyctiphanis]
MTKILITGFDAFGGAAINPTAEIIKELEGEVIAGAELVVCRVPVVRYDSLKTVMDAISEYQPDAVVCLGQAAGRKGVTPERVAINLDDFRIPDNAGHQVIDEPVVQGAPAAYFSTLPIKAMVRDMTEAGIEASVSESAGTFVCNHLFYALQHALNGTGIRNGFVHVPLLPEQAKDNSYPSMPLDMMTEAVRVMVKTLQTVQGDISVTGGKIC